MPGPYKFTGCGLVPLLCLCALLGSCDTDHCDPEGPRVACVADHASAQQCLDLGCCWQPVIHRPGDPHIQQAWCFFQNAGGSLFTLQNVQDKGTEVVGTLVTSEAWLPQLGPDISPLKLHVDLQQADTVHVKITAKGQVRWEVPQWLFKRPLEGESSKGSAGRLYDFKYTAEPFQLEVLRSGAKDELGAIFSTVGQRFAFKDQYLEVQTKVPAASSLYGAGERSASGGFRLARHGLPLALWNVGVEAKTPDQNLYGSQPFVMEVRPDGSTHGTLLLNSNGMDIVAGAAQLSFRAIGGVLDLYIFLGPTPADVMEQLTRVIGRPALPPFWSLGFHQSKWGYKSVEELQQVVANYSAAAIPLDTIWSDIDYMDGYRDFTFDPKAYPEHKMKAFVDALHAKGQCWVPILDPGILVKPGYKPYEDGLAAGIFIKDVTGKPYMGQVWPGQTHFPDFLCQQGAAYWRDQIAGLHVKVPFDGLWIDMNEVANFCTGQACAVGPQGPPQRLSRHALSSSPADMTGFCQLDCTSAIPPPSKGKLSGLAGAPYNASQYEELMALLDPPYKISNCNELKDLGWFTLPVTARHVNGEREYDAHNLYGLSEAAATANALRNITGHRPFVLTRSNFLGMGAYAAHWTGDNAAAWRDLRWSLTSIFTAGLQGVPFAGADICGFSANTTEELCTRWISLGAFYPFSRDHTDHRSYQELYRWPKVAAAARQALGLRYQLLPYLYTAFHDSMQHGWPVARPLFFAFPGDPATHTRDEQFLLGDSLLISPCLHQGATTVDAYFPSGLWYSVWDHRPVDARAGGVNVTLAAPLGEVPVHVRAGSVVPLQQAGMTTAAVKASALTLLAALRPPLAHLGIQHGSPSASQDAQGQAPRAPADHAPADADCRGSWAAAADTGAAVACGKLFVDDGVQAEEDAKRSGSMHFVASVRRPAGSASVLGLVEVRFADNEHINGNLTDWCRNTPFPELREVVVLGVDHPPDPDSLSLDLVHAPEMSPGGQETISLAGAQAGHDAHTQRLHIRGLPGAACPHWLRISWTTSLSGATTTA
ncbi:hypothetical protein WJX72_007179 [[Myrmecia] bisecta]|uniref:alpha-glucosidase n=1 Tax=[Myrmecia] bisecta TaxID=41462 RepID=A0AAW1Q2Z5_9CHLO